MNSGSTFTGAPQVPARFEVRGELGRGGMAVVYHAYDLVGERDVALKFLPPTEDEQLKKRFQREAVDLAAVYHPNIVDFYAVGESQGLEFIEMEYVDGGSLAAFARDCDSLRTLLSVFVQICDGLQHLHECGVVHRDIKPANILMTKGGSPKISDMGLARREEGRSQLTQDGALLGTASYLAPEQLMSHAVGPSADLYALGVCLFEAVTCRHPFTAEGPMAMLRAHLDEKPPSPSELLPGLPARLDKLILGLLQKNPASRPANAAEVGSELRLCLEELTPAQELLVASSPEGLLNRAGLLLDDGQAGEANRLLELAESKVGQDSTMALRLELARAKAAAVLGEATAVEQARAAVQACRNGQIKLLGQALLILGQAATAREFWDEALAALQEARELIPSSQRQLQVGLMDSLANLHEKGSMGGHPSLSRDESKRYREIAQGLARRSESVSQSSRPPSTASASTSAPLPPPISPLSQGIPTNVLPSPSVESVPKAKEQTSKRPLILLALGLASLMLAAGFGYRWWTGRPGHLEVTAEPKEAVVMIDSVRYPSPLKSEFKAGTHKIKVFAQGFKSHEESITLEPGQTMKLRANLEPASGGLNLGSTPKGAKLFLNGQARGVTPVNLEGLPPKKFKVKLVKEGYKPYEGSVEVQAGKTKNLAFAMEKKPPPPPPPAARYQAPSYSGSSGYSGGGGYSGGSSRATSSSRPSYNPPPRRNYSLPRVNIPSNVEFRRGGVKVRF